MGARAINPQAATNPMAITRTGKEAEGQKTNRQNSRRECSQGNHATGEAADCNYTDWIIADRNKSTSMLPPTLHRWSIDGHMHQRISEHLEF